MPSVKPAEIIKLLKQHNFYIDRQSGSHAIFRHQQDRNLRVTVPMHNKDLKIKTLLSILKQANLPSNAWKK